MNDIVSTPPAPASPEGSMVTTGAWWPDVDVNDIRQRVNLRGELPHARLVDAIEWGVIHVTTELTRWASAAIVAGANSLTDVDPLNRVNGAPLLERLFIGAVASTAAARLIERHPDITATREGSDRAEQRYELAAAFRRDATHAIRTMMGRSGTTVELI
ncbi:head completion/stabilization protein [Altericroceibacterium endophyticum]|uniref:Head completion/stabilization protein n=1 Tax=Altericroceibacterium endophyticum TaxID=1808508 RepID=A0A6I4T1T2_9SPHN|nr:head completion/stabilization protein [Altericroceibacterium endophyticum]MXO64838.1 hypothetical protein [Altericroceibacterium endophyticum]